MKKGLFLIVAMMCGLSVLAGAAFAGYLVSGAGRDGVDGLYCESSDDSCGPQISFEKAGSPWVIFEGCGSWVIGYRVFAGINGTCDAITSTYLNDKNTSSPPLSNWYALSSSDEPAPTLRYQSCDDPEAVPTVTEWGMIIMSLLLIG